MIYIGTSEQDGSAIYFDVYAAEQNQRGVMVSGTIGDGSYEGDVSVELGRAETVTFADAWLDGERLRAFLARCGAEDIEQTLIRVVREMALFRPKRTHSRSDAFHGASRVAEQPTLWKGVA